MTEHLTKEPPVRGAAPAPAEVTFGLTGGSVLGWMRKRRRRIVLGVWAVVTVLCVGLVAYGLGALLESRQQRSLLREIRGDMARAAGAQQTLFAAKVQPRVEPGDPVAVVQVPRLGLQQVVVEGAGPRQTQAGPGHVPGTAGVAQPGNSVVVARRYGFGAPFLRLPSLRTGDDIIVSTVQGRALYKVRSVGRTNLTRKDVYAPSTDDRLTLLTSASPAPWESGRAVVVVAQMNGLPFPVTPQGERSQGQDGRHGDLTALWALVLPGGGFALSAWVATVLYRRWLTLSTYVLSAPVMVAMLVLTAEAATRLLPAWS